MIRRLVARFGLPALAFFLGACLCVPIFFGHFFNYGAESISIASLLRMAAGQAWVSAIDDSPLLVSVFNPLYLLPAWPVAWMAGPGATLVLAVTGRLLSLVALALLLREVAGIYRAHWPAEYSPYWLRVMMVLFALSFAPLLFAFRPDFLSFLLEVVALAQLLNGKTVRAALLTGLAVVAKYNTLGLLVGGTLWMLHRRRLRDALAFAGVGVAVIGASLVALYLLFGERVLTNHLFGLGGDRVAVDWTLVHGFLAGFAAPQALFLVFVVCGLKQLRRSAPEAAGLVACFLVASFAIATAGQLRPGAYYNYYYGFFAVGLVPAASSAARWLQGGVRTLPWTAFLATLAFHGAEAARPSATVILNQIPNYPYEALREYLDRRWPSARVYATDPTLLVIFHDRAVIGPWAEAFVLNSPPLQPFADRVRSVQRQAGGIDLVLVSGRNCAQWTPDGLFAPELAGVRTLDRHLGKLCVFARD